MFEKIFGIFRKRKKADVSQQIPGDTGEDVFGVGDTGMEEDFDAETISLETGMSDGEKLKLEQMMMQTGTYSVNEIRQKRGDDPLPGEKFEVPGGQQQNAPGSSETAPMFTRGIEP